MTDPITTPAQMREALDAALADYTPGIDCAVRFVTIDQVDMLAEFYLHNRALPMADPLCTWPSCGHTAKGQCRTYTSGQLIAPNDASITATNTPVAEPEPQAVKVKPLVWVREDGRSEEHPKWTADVDAKRYEVFTAWWGDQDKWGFVALGRFYHTEADAIAAAEADHAARIRSQIEAERTVDASETPVCDHQPDLLSESERQAIRDQALEDAAQAASNRAAYWWNEATAADDTGRTKLSLSYEAKALACTELAAAIRVMKGKPE